MKPRKVRTPGAPPETPETPESRKKKKERKEAKKAGRPKKALKARRAKINLRANYTEEDLAEAVRLVRMEGWSKKGAAAVINERKANIVPRMTLVDRLKQEPPLETPKLGRTQVLSAGAKEGLVKCLEILRNSTTLCPRGCSRSLFRTTSPSTSAQQVQEGSLALGGCGNFATGGARV